jgi:transcriptional regulator with GAF, ATPase, and Fis domain
MGFPIIGVSENIKKVRELITLVASNNLNVLIFGETGVGKDLVAQCLHQESPRANKPFIKVNCAALPQGLLESELFGYEKGAFTGAERKTRGKFELAHTGVLFLDEIGEIALSMQSKLLHVLQGSEFTPLGSEKSVKTDTWIITATNRNLEEDVMNKRFREDLYFRLNIIKIHVAPLRERPEDIPFLVDFYLKQYSSQFNNNGIQKPGQRIRDKLVAYHWPGNVRQLQNWIKKGLILNDWDEALSELPPRYQTIENQISEKPFPQELTFAPDIIRPKNLFPEDLDSFSLRDTIKKIQDKAEREIMSYVLEKTGWNRRRAAKILKISYRTLLYKISDLNLEPPF